MTNGVRIPTPPFGLAAEPQPYPAHSLVLDVESIRARFPALARRHAGHPVAYFDGPGGTQVPSDVADAMRHYLLHRNANTHWPYPTSEETDADLAAAREALADLLNAASDEISFGANMTTITFHVARGLGRAWGPGDEVVVTELDHHANIAPWHALARDRGITVRTVRMLAERGTLDWDQLESCIGPRTRLVAVGAASNALGTINDIVRVARLARAAGALSFIDAVHYAPHNLVDVRAIDCDFLACSAYKFYGPHIGVLYSRRQRLAAIDIPKLAPAPEVGPERLETGTQNHEGIVGAAAAVNFLAALGAGRTRRERLASTYAELHRRGTSLVTRMWDGLTKLPGVTVYGTPPHAPRTPTLGFVVQGIDADDVARHLVKRGVFCSSGDFYATTVIERLGHAREGVVRAGCSCYTSAEEVDRLLEGIGELTR